MHPPTRHPCGQQTAYPWHRRFAGFARRRRLWQSGRTDRVQGTPSRPARPLTPSPHCRSARPTRGPGFAQVSANPWAGAEFSFPTRELRVYCRDITTNHPRGRAPCVSIPSFWRQLPRPSLLVACRIPHRAGLPVPLPARFWPMSPTATSLPGPSSAVWRARQAAASTSAFPPATTTDLSALGPDVLTSKTIRADRPGGLSAFRAQGDRPCSTRF